MTAPGPARHPRRAPPTVAPPTVTVAAGGIRPVVDAVTGAQAVAKRSSAVEVAAHAALDHPHLVRPVGVMAGAAGADPVLVFARAPGGSLAGHLEAGGPVMEPRLTAALGAVSELSALIEVARSAQAVLDIEREVQRVTDSHDERRRGAVLLGAEKATLSAPRAAVRGGGRRGQGSAEGAPGGVDVGQTVAVEALVPSVSLARSLNISLAGSSPSTHRSSPGPLRGRGSSRPRSCRTGR